MNASITNALSLAAVAMRDAINLEARGSYLLAHHRRRYARRMTALAERLRAEQSFPNSASSLSQSSVVASGVAVAPEVCGDDTDPPCGSNCTFSTYVRESTHESTN